MSKRDEPTELPTAGAPAGLRARLELGHDGGRVIDAYLELANDGRATIRLDRVEVTEPAGARIAWARERVQGFPHPTLESAALDRFHHVTIELPPGAVAGCGMVVELPFQPDGHTRLALECRVFVAGAPDPRRIGVALDIAQAARGPIG